MLIELSEYQKYKVVKLNGEIDFNNSKQLKVELLELLNAAVHVAVDFSSLTYIDSSGIASLVEAFNTAKAKEIEFHIVGAKDAPLQVLQLTRLDSVFSLFPSLEQVGR